MTVRQAYARAFTHGIYVVWPILSGLLAVITAIGALVGLLEGWGVGRGIYFGFITALTIGYGDHVPTHVATRVLAVLTGFAGIAMTALLAAVAVHAFQASRTN